MVRSVTMWFIVAGFVVRFVPRAMVGSVMIRTFLVGTMVILWLVSVWTVVRPRTPAMFLAIVMIRIIVLSSVGISIAVSPLPVIPSSVIWNFRDYNR